jgi:hypothetical protein
MHCYADCEIVEFELVETEVGDTMSVSEYLHQIQMKKAEEERLRKERYEAEAQKRRYEKYQQLKAEFE